MTDIIMLRDSSGQNTFAPPALCEHRYRLGLEKDAIQSITIPSQFKSCCLIFANQSGGNLYVSYDGVDPSYSTAGSPTLTNTDQNPNQRWLKGGGNVVKFLTSDTVLTVTVSIYSSSGSNT